MNVSAAGYCRNSASIALSKPSRWRKPTKRRQLPRQTRPVRYTIPFDSEKVDYKFLCYYQLGRDYQSRIKFLMSTSIPYTYLWILSSIITQIQFITIRVLVLYRVNLALAMMLYVAFYTPIVALFVLKVFRAKIQHNVAWSLQDLHYKRNLYGWFTVHNILEMKEKEKRNKPLKQSS